MIIKNSLKVALLSLFCITLVVVPIVVLARTVASESMSATEETDDIHGPVIVTGGRETVTVDGHEFGVESPDPEPEGLPPVAPCITNGFMDF